ncbi:MAG: glyceraldehyde 3-phosphate dehydrogenase NAD-binding domain-containing protein, partial [candidate division WWE3 bacterium]|nr:glyceraldehyde 3-phosphate dehydrogenase NAD-binding domain-containing protein [candidate division WWE3 bacterium]
MNPTRIAINGFGRIGRTFFRIAFERPELEIVALNDLGEPENLAYLLRYDTVYGRYGKPVKIEDGQLVVGDKKIKLLNEKDPVALPWDKLDV